MQLNKQSHCQLEAMVDIFRENSLPPTSLHPLSRSVLKKEQEWEGEDDFVWNKAQSAVNVLSYFATNTQSVRSPMGLVTKF
jgi:hypothetical protein